MDGVGESGEVKSGWVDGEGGEVLRDWFKQESKTQNSKFRLLPSAFRLSLTPFVG